MNEQELYKFFLTLSKEEQLQLAKRMENINLVGKISDEVFMKAVEDLFKNYPIFKEQVC